MITGIFTKEEIEQLNEMYELTSKIIEKKKKNNEVYIDTSVGMYNITLTICCKVKILISEFLNVHI